MTLDENLKPNAVTGVTLMKITIFNIYFLKILSLGLKFIFIWQDNHLIFTFVPNCI